MRAGLTRALATGGAAAATAAVGLIGLLHVLDPATSPVRRLLSDYAFGARPGLFDAAVLLLAAGSGAVLAALVRARVVAPRGRTLHLLTAWSVGMTVMVAFPTADWAVRPTVSGVVHGVASVAAFVALPVAARRIAADHTLRPGAPVLRLLASACFVLLVPMVLLATAFVPLPAGWVTPPMGLAQRALGLAEVALVVVLGGWARSAVPR